MTVSAQRRSVLITGGASGIGAAVAAAFSAHGDRVAVFDRDPPAASIERSVRWVAGDVTSPADNEAAVAAAADESGGLDVLVGNAGVHDGNIGFETAPAAELVSILDQVLKVDVTGYVLAARAAAGALRRRNGCMIFTLSDASFEVSGNGAGIAYTAAKHGALGVVRYLARALAPSLRVNAVAPGGVLTQLKAVLPDGERRDLCNDPQALAAEVRALNPLGIVLSPQELSELYVFLASPAAAGMTGEVLRADGGLSLR